MNMKELRQIERKYYDFLIGSGRNFKAQIDFLDKIFKKHKVKTILDCGCGTGTHSVLLAKKGYKITSFDFSKNQVGIARKKAKANKVKINFKVADIRNFDFGKFDAVITLYSVLMFACKNKTDLEKAVKSMKNSLNPNGIAFFETCTPVVLKSPSLEVVRHIGKDFKIGRFSFRIFNKKTRTADIKYVYALQEGNKKIKITESKASHIYFDKKDVVSIMKKLDLKTIQLYGSFSNKKGIYKKFDKNSRFISPFFRLK